MVSTLLVTGRKQNGYVSLNRIFMTRLRLFLPRETHTGNGAARNTSRRHHPSLNRFSVPFFLPFENPTYQPVAQARAYNIIALAGTSG
jgi:hypothetical protein